MDINLLFPLLAGFQVTWLRDLRWLTRWFCGEVLGRSCNMFLCLATLVGFSYGTSHDKLSLMNLPGVVSHLQTGMFLQFSLLPSWTEVKGTTTLAALILHCSQDDRIARTCDLCQEAFEDVAQLHMHLHSAHPLQVHDWNPARDAMPDTDACTHCGLVFDTRDGLGRHIVDGRCPHFNPQATNFAASKSSFWFYQHSLCWLNNIERC